MKQYSTFRNNFVLLKREEMFYIVQMITVLSAFVDLSDILLHFLIQS